jgi:hypothetical protein
MSLGIPVAGTVTRVSRRGEGHWHCMTTQPDPADGTLVEREGVNAASDRSTAEGDGPLPSAETTLTGGSTTGQPADRHVGTGTSGGMDTTPSQAWSGDTGGVVDPEAGYSSESGQDVGSID